MRLFRPDCRNSQFSTLCCLSGMPGRFQKNGIAAAPTRNTPAMLDAAG